MSPRRKRPKNDELLELVRIREHMWELQRIWLAAADERQEADRAAKRLLVRELEDWKREMRKSGRGGRNRGIPVEPRSAERVEAERVLAEATEREREALKRSHEAGERNWEYRKVSGTSPTRTSAASSSSAAGRRAATWTRCARAQGTLRM